jgi:hypothetical protein
MPQVSFVLRDMIIESDRKTRSRHVGPYKCEGPLGDIDIRDSYVYA